MRHAIALLAVLAVSAPAGAAELDELETAAQQEENPLSGVTNLQIQNVTNYLMGPNERSQNFLALSPTLPLRLGSWVTLNANIRIPLVWHPDVADRTASAFGLGDISLNLPLTHTFKEILYVGVGPILRFPTATDNRLGDSDSGKFSLGPAVTMRVTPSHWVLGVSANNIWSVAGRDTGKTVNKLSLTPSVIYNLPLGYYITTSVPISADWAVPESDRWEVAVGGGLGSVKLLTKKIGLNFEVQAFGSVVRPDLKALWALYFQVALFFPRLKPGPRS